MLALPAMKKPTAIKAWIKAGTQEILRVVGLPGLAALQAPQFLH